MENFLTVHMNTIFNNPENFVEDQTTKSLLKFNEEVELKTFKKGITVSDLVNKLSENIPLNKLIIRRKLRNGIFKINLSGYVEIEGYPGQVYYDEALCDIHSRIGTILIDIIDNLTE